MKVLFVSSGNSQFGITAIVKNQGESLRNNGIDIDYFPINGKGVLGYSQNLIALKKYIRLHSYDVVHAHYALCGLASILSLRIIKIPIVVSYMGSDLYGSVCENGKKKKSSYLNIIISQFLQLFVRKIIVKSENLEQYIYFKKKSCTIPNGVNLDALKLIDKKLALSSLNLPSNKKYILFLGNPSSKRKNIKLLHEAIELIDAKNIRILAPYPIPFSEINLYLNAADVLAHTSYLEGSPNVIKEAMACSCSIVATDVGDVKWVIGDTEGCYVCSFDPLDVASKLNQALEYSVKYGRTEGRRRLIELGLDSESIAKRLISVYQSVLR